MAHFFSLTRTLFLMYSKITKATKFAKKKWLVWRWRSKWMWTVGNLMMKQVIRYIKVPHSHQWPVNDIIKTSNQFQFMKGKEWKKNIDRLNICPLYEVPCKFDNDVFNSKDAVLILQIQIQIVYKRSHFLQGTLWIGQIWGPKRQKKKYWFYKQNQGSCLFRKDLYI